MEIKETVLLFFNSKVDKPVFRYYKYLDRQITKNFAESGIEPRPVKGNGLWCCLLLPSILMIYSHVFHVSQLYKLIAYLSLGLLCYSILFIMFISISCAVLNEITNSGCSVAALVASLLIYARLSKDLIFTLPISICCVLAYCVLLRIALTKCPRTFTVGEAMIVAQSIILFTVMSVGLVFGETDEEITIIKAVVYTVLSTVGLIVTALYNMTDSERTLTNFCYVIAAAAGFALIALHYELGINCVMKVLLYVFMDMQHIKMFSFWLLMLIAAAVIVVARTMTAVKASTVTRKSFHVLAAMVFAVGIIGDLNFMLFATGIAFCALILVEALRKSNVETISPALQSAFNVYGDEKDCGSFAVTPVYLFAGLAAPLLLVPAHGAARLELLSGVLATGVGDTAACWFGERYGHYTWPDGSKTYEGTLFNILSQIAVVYLLDVFELLDCRSALLRTAVAATASGLVEARTNQVDNLILPLITIMAFQATSFLS